MATDTSKVVVPSGPVAKGIIYRAKLGTVLPKDEAEELTEDYKNLGGVSDAGITNAQSRDTTDILDFDSEVVATPQTNYTETFTVELIEATNVEALKTTFGDKNVTFTPATKTKGAKLVVRHNAQIMPKSVFVIDTIHGDGMRRQVIPIGQVTSVGDVTQVSKDIIKYSLTIKTFKYVDADKNADYVIEYIDEGIPDADAADGS